MVGCIADRRDFYHQFGISDERALTNCIYPPLRPTDLEDTEAFGSYCEKFLQSKRRKRREPREVQGDRLLMTERKHDFSASDPVVAAFGALYQGDHLGVEFATDSHCNLLKEHGLLSPGSQLRSDQCLQDDAKVSGLVIDDFFVISKEKLSTPVDQSKAFADFCRAKEVYASQKILGSDDKDVVSQRRFKVIGAEVISSEDTVARGAVVLGAPVEKRLGLALISAQQAALSFTSDSLWSSIVGSWISVLSFRKPAMSLMNEVFHVIPPEELDTSCPVLRALRRKPAEELLQLAVLSPVLVSNLAVPILDQIFATDASSTHGGIASAGVSKEIALTAWRSSDRRGQNVPLLTRVQANLSQIDTMYEPAVGGFSGGGPFEEDSEAEPKPQRPIGMRFEFIEVCGGAGSVTKYLAESGVRCGPIIDLSYSRWYNLADRRVLSWILFMFEEDRLAGVMVEPPCTTFSAAAHPALRSYKIPRGYNPKYPRTRLGNILAFAALVIFFAALRYRKFGLGEQPRRSKMRWLAEWQRLLLLGAVEVSLASCAYGSLHQKEFCLIAANMEVGSLHRPCTRDHVHIPIQGKWTKASAVYTPALAQAIAGVFQRHFEAKRRAVARTDIATEGLEDVFTNDLASGLAWKEEASWRWKGSSHINLSFGPLLKMVVIADSLFSETPMSREVLWQKEGAHHLH